MKTRIAKLAVVMLAAGTLIGIGRSAQANDCPATGASPSQSGGSFSVQTPIGGLCGAGSATTQKGHIWLDGESTPIPALGGGGYIHVGNDNNGDPDNSCTGSTCGNGDAEPDQEVCSDDNGGPRTGGSSPMCIDIPG